MNSCTNGLAFFYSGIPHLAVSNSTPPPSSSSPAPVKIKAEPISPPRDQLLSQHQQQSIVTSLGGTSSIIGLTHSSTASSLGSNLNHSHLMNSRPSSTGHLTPTPGTKLIPCTYTEIALTFISFQVRQLRLRHRVIWDITISQSACHIYPIMILQILRTQNDQEYQKVGLHSPTLVPRLTAITNIIIISSIKTTIIWMSISFNSAWTVARQHHLRLHLRNRQTSTTLIRKIHRRRRLTISTIGTTFQTVS